jgi:Trk-type K+ transport system membrane component
MRATVSIIIIGAILFSSLYFHLKTQKIEEDFYRLEAILNETQIIALFFLFLCLILACATIMTFYCLKTRCGELDSLDNFFRAESWNLKITNIIFCLTYACRWVFDYYITPNIMRADVGIMPCAAEPLGGDCD